MTSEHRYRQLLRLFPVAWRAENEEEIMATLLEAAGPGRRSVTLAEAADLVRCALVLRYRAAVVRSPTRVGPAVLALASAVVAALVLRFWIGGISAEFWLTSLVVALVPGTGVVYTLSTSICGGRRRGLFAAVGCTLGVVPHVLAAMLGLSGVMQTGAVAFEVVRWAGVAYLVLMGVSMIRHGGTQRLDDGTAGSETMGQVVRRAILLNLLNPKLTLFFFAFLPQFLDGPAGPLAPKLLGLGAAFMLVTLVVFVAYAWASAAVRERVLAAPAVLRWAQRALGTLVIGFAARLAVTDR